jgi:AmiR/NasT family two-component response regulator
MRWTTTHAPGRRERPRWRVGVLASDVRTRAELARSIEAHGGVVVVDSSPRADIVDLLRRMDPDAVVLAAEDAMEQEDLLMGPLACGASSAMVLLTSPESARTLRIARGAGVMAVLLRPLRAQEVGPTLDVAMARFRELRRFKRALADRVVV